MDKFYTLLLVICLFGIVTVCLFNTTFIKINKTGINRLEEKVEKLEKKTVKREYELTVTAYTASEDETDSTPNQTSLMVKPVVGRTIAVSRDLRKFYGAKVWIEGFGVRVVEDTMNKRYSKRVDILVGSKEQARKIGRSERKVIFFDLNR